MRNPFKIMKNPRVFMRKLMEGDRPSGWWLAGIMGFMWCFTRANFLHFLKVQGDIPGYSLPSLMALSVVLAIPVGYIFIYISSFFLYWVSKMFKGKASFDGVFQAILRTRIVDLMIAILYIIAWLVFGELFLFESFTNILWGGALLTAMPGFGVLIILAGFWQLVILTHALGEVSGTSSWIALCPVIITGVIMVIIGIAIDGSWLAAL